MDKMIKCQHINSQFGAFSGIKSPSRKNLVRIQLIYPPWTKYLIFFVLKQPYPNSLRESLLNGLIKK